MPPVSYPTLAKVVRQPSDFIPSGWKAVAIKTGDLNGDRRSDVAILMRMKDPANIKPVKSDPYYKQDDTNPYLLAIGFARLHGYTLAASHHALFPREVAPMHGDDPPGADSVKISRGVLTMTFGHLRGFDQFRFRWNGKDFSLIGYECAGVAGGHFSSVSANYLTRKARIEDGEIDSDKTHISTMPIRPGKRPTLGQIDWEYGTTGTDVSGNDLSC